MKVVILAGGFGTRISSAENNLPKPMLKIGEKPIIHHIMDIYSYYGHKDFYLALGYKSEIIKSYFKNYYINNSDIKIDLNNNNIEVLNENKLDWNISLINTGLSSLTAKRLKHLEKFVGNETFLMTYGDGVSDIDIMKLVDFHKKNKKIATVTAVRPTAKFGDLTLEENIVKAFNEKNQINQGWISGGFFVFEPDIFNMINKEDNLMLERTILKQLAEKNELVAYKHEGFWQCMDTQKDYHYLQELWSKNPIWHKV